MSARSMKGYALPAVTIVLLALLGSVAACGDDGGTEADRIGVAAACTTTADCPVLECDAEPCRQLECLTQFSGGYCGLSNCTGDIDCPVGSSCVMHDDGSNYCFRVCLNKSECNVNRPADVEANCSSNVEFVDPQDVKACVPPSSGT